MKKLFYILLIGLLLFPCTALCKEKSASKMPKTKSVAINYETKDNFVMSATLYFPAQKKQKYPMIVFLHSLGYTGQYWDVLPYLATKAGFAALVVDLRGHGKSIYNIDYKLKTWNYLSLKGFSKYPSDVQQLVEYVFNTNKKIAKDYAFVGADIGANTAILATKDLSVKPFAMVLISPMVKIKGLYVPITMANNGPIPILAIAGIKDTRSYSQLFELKKFAQGTYEIKSYPVGGTGMLLLKSNPHANYEIINWLVKAHEKSFK